MKQKMKILKKLKSVMTTMIMNGVNIRGKTEELNEINKYDKEFKKANNFRMKQSNWQKMDNNNFEECESNEDNEENMYSL